jgi:nucleotide-binding universal stress UspA family protein
MVMRSGDMDAAGNEGGGLLIVVGVNGTTGSNVAVDWAVREARLRSAAVHLVLVRDPAVSRRAPYARPAATGTGDADSGAARLAEAAGRAARQLAADRVTSELIVGLPAQVLADRAAGAQLLVLGARPADDPNGLVGPVARACLRHSPCPVVVAAERQPAECEPAAAGTF